MNASHKASVGREILGQYLHTCRPQTYDHLPETVAGGFEVVDDLYYVTSFCLLLFPTSEMGLFGLNQLLGHLFAMLENLFIKFLKK